VTKRIRLDAEAEQEFEASALWYRARRPGLGDEFFAEVEAALQRVVETPEAFAPAPGVAPRFGVRRAPVRRFPYYLVFLERESEIRVLAVVHARRRPGYWKHRLSR
jgi:plasmid stabilization system protein ParE